MGDITSFLIERRCGKGIYAPEARIEIEEAIHVHYRDFRFLLNGKDFNDLYQAMTDAYEKWVAMGMPETVPSLVPLGKRVLSGGIANDRFGIEKQRDGTIHVHYHDLRIHLSPADFYWMAISFGKAKEKHAAEGKKVMISIAADGKLSADGYTRVTYHDVVHDHVRTIKHCPLGLINHEVTFRNKIVDTWSDVGDRKTRCLGLPPNFPKSPPTHLDAGYLMALYQSMKQRGYDHTHFPIVTYDLGNGGLYVKDSHRIACLIALGTPEFMAVVLSPETGWNE
jgi:hypothetical protein